MAISIAKLNASFAAFGRASAARKYTLLFFSLTIALFLSCPTIQRLRDSLYAASITANTDNDHFWQYSSHVHPAPFHHNAQSDSLVAYQIRLAAMTTHQQQQQQPVTQHFLTRAQAWYRAFTTTKVAIDDQYYSLIDLPTSQIMLYSPFDDSYWQQQTDIPEQWETTLASIINGSTHALDPLSVFDNVTLDKHGRFVCADSIIITALLHQDNGSNLAERVWKAVVEQHVNTLSSWKIRQLDAPVQTWQYKFKPFDYDIPLKVYLFLVVHTIIFFLVSGAFGKTQFVKSQYGLGLAAVFTSITCVAVTLAVLDWFGAKVDAVPWYLFPLVANVATLENVLLLTNAVLNAGCDMQVKEKVGRGLQSVGVPMLGTLVAELIILEIGRAMDVPTIKQFCLFAQAALIVEYLLDMTFFIAILAIDVNRAELADLDDRQVSKRLRELAIAGTDPDQRPPDYCPVQDDEDEGDVTMTCADCKEFKTHRAMNALMLCLVILGISMFHSTLEKYMVPETFMLPPAVNQRVPLPSSMILKTERLRTMSNQFWDTINPERQTQWIRVEPPYVATFSMESAIDNSPIWTSYEEQYLERSLSLAQKNLGKRPPSRLRSFVLGHVQRMIVLLWHINLPICALSIVLIGMLLWLNPSSRDQWLAPMFKKVAFKLLSQNFMSCNIIARRIRDHFSEQSSSNHESVQQQQQQQQQQHRENVTIKTLSGQHVADVRRFDANAKHQLAVSCGQDDRIVMWDMEKGRAMGRLEDAADSSSSSAKHIKIDQGNKWVVGAMSSGVVRIWSACTSKMVRDFYIEREELASVTTSLFPSTNMMRNRRTGNAITPISSTTSSTTTGTTHNSNHSNNNNNNNSNSNNNNHHRLALGALDRVLDVQFLGAVAEYCHPAVEQVAAKAQQGGVIKSQNYVVSVHKSGMLREWDILSGACMQTIPSGHTRDVSILHVVESKRPHRKHGVSWVFTAGKDGRVTCWERQLVSLGGDENDQVSQWTCAYTFVGHEGHAITSLATELPVGGMGILVTGASNGSVKVWNFETGALVCALTAEERAKDDTAAMMVTTSGNNSIVQLTVTRYCEVEYGGRGMCRGCDTCFGNGFLIAACTTHDRVDTWRLERVGGGGNHHGSCTLCSKDYHRTQYRSSRRRRADSNASASSSTSSTSSPAVAMRRKRRHVIRGGPPKRQQQQNQHDQGNDDDILTGLLDIEQLAGEGEIELTSTYLGNIDQPAGRGITFCGSNKLLAGVRRSSSSSTQSNSQWQVWFAQLQYFDPPGEIPIDTFDLETNEDENTMEQQQHHDESRDSLFGLFGSNSITSSQRRPSMHKARNHSNKSLLKKMDDIQEDEEFDEEAYELLPFSMVRHVLPLDGLGLACDFGNFIKLIYLDREQSSKRMGGAGAGAATMDDCSKSSLQSSGTNSAVCAVPPSACSILPNCPKASECRAIASKKHLFS